MGNDMRVGSECREEGVARANIELTGIPEAQSCR